MMHPPEIEAVKEIRAKYDVSLKVACQMARHAQLNALLFRSDCDENLRAVVAMIIDDHYPTTY
jgi:hypothetical protein